MDPFPVLLTRHFGGQRGAARQLADRIGVNESTVSRWMTGETAPGKDRAAELAGILGYTLEEILESLVMVRKARSDERVERIQAARKAALQQELRGRTRR
jgi:transcriptional regulator with XRE-family HTH domain